MKQSATLDSSFWINAHRAGLLPFVLGRFEIFYGRSVGDELSERFPSGREFWNLVRAGALTEALPTTQVVKEHGPGERQAMNLALDHPEWFLLMDDRRPLQEAQRLGLKTICTPVLVVALFRDGLLDLDRSLQVLARLTALRTVSPVLIQAAVAQLEIEVRREES